MDPPLPDDFDPYLAEEKCYSRDDARNTHKKQKDDDCNTKPTEGRPERPGRDEAPEFPELPQDETSMLKALFEFFIPPRNEDPETNRRWKIAIGFAVFVLSFSTLFGYGILQPLGFSGFAYADDVRSIKVELLEQRIFDARLLQCNANTPESRAFYAAKVQELQSKFRQTEGQYPPLPTCAEVR